MNEILLLSLGISFAINIAMFLVAFRFKSDKLTDISYAVTFIVLALYGYLQSSRDTYHLLLFIMVSVWAVRIGGFLLYRVIQRGKDARFDGMREDFIKFGRFWVLQAITVWVVLIASIFAFTRDGQINVVTTLGFLTWLTGLTVEAIADAQKYKFSQAPKNIGIWIDKGLWHYSRHPNYFGEILVWVGVYIVAITSLSLHQALIAAISPLFIATLLIFVSGIPLLEKAADKKWGGKKEYQQYKSSTSVLVPLPKRK